ncbi:MAG: DNA mismatch repair endonuclease MutL [Clostridia bacterium]|nr:DNA mismatch repair endonuclease MutL [Clostridia bacterium]
MPKINLLEPKVFNMLAAGEVVERPASVVKELVENAVDAGATEVYVQIEEGGIRKIQVSDNGIGIEKEDLRAAFLPHATSKLKNITDLDSLATLGFRGEALASIASVSEVTLISKNRGGEVANKIVLNGGQVVEETPASRTDGTTITVENLFFNTPARLKFLKKAASEQRFVADMVKILIFANPKVSITLSSEDGTLLKHKGGDLLDAIYSVYGAKVADNLIEIKPSEFGNIKVSGYTSKVDYTKPNRTYQTIIVNSRPVEDVTIVTAVEKAYAEFLMKRTYPMFVVDIVMPFDDVDSNVHPAKTEVRFRDKHAVFSAVYHAVKDSVEEFLKTVSFGFEKPSSLSESDLDDVFGNLNRQNDGEVPASNAQAGETEKPKFAQTRLDTSSLYDLTHRTSKVDFSNLNFGQKSNVLKDSSVIEDAFEKDLNAGYGDLTKPDERILNETADDEQEYGVFDGKIVGQIFDTYIIVERDDLVYFIDQHAAHERILYDKLVSKFSVEHTQALLVPYKLSLTAEESEYLEDVLPQLEELGFEIKRNGTNFLVYAVPEPVANLSLDKFFLNLFKNLNDEKPVKLTDLLREKLCQTACKAAIKGGEALSRGQIERVLKNYLDENGKLPSQCPHGRPAVVAFTKTDVEKMFKRIV